MEEGRVKQSSVYKVDLTQIQGDGDFPCPKCGITISPDDETETVYTILETRVKRDVLEELVILCNSCGSKIRLVGFLPSQPFQAETGDPSLEE